MFRFRSPVDYQSSEEELTEPRVTVCFPVAALFLVKVQFMYNFAAVQQHLLTTQIRLCI